MNLPLIIIVVYLAVVTIVGALLARKCVSYKDWAVASGGMDIIMVAAGIAKIPTRRLRRFTRSKPHSFKKSRCDEEQDAVCKQARERSMLRDQAGVILRSTGRCVFALLIGSGLERRTVPVLLQSPVCYSCFAALRCPFGR